MAGTLKMETQGTIPNYDERPIVRQDLCIPDCLYKTSDKEVDFIRCCLCMKWHHVECLDIDDDESKGF